MEQETELRTRINSGLALGNILSRWLSTGMHARIIFDANYQLVWANEQFLRSRDDYNFLSIERGTFKFVKKKDQARLEDIVDNFDNLDGFLIASDSEGGRNFAIQVQRIECDRMIDHFGLRIAMYEDYLSSSFKHFQDIYHLTNKEVEICYLLLAGKTVHEIADHKASSQDTVRFHIRNIYMKMNISSREEFFANLRHFMFS